MNRTCDVIITRTGLVLFGDKDDQHGDIIVKNGLQRDEEIAGYYNFYSPSTFTPCGNYYLYDEDVCDDAIELFLTSNDNGDKHAQST